MEELVATGCRVVSFIFCSIFAKRLAKVNTKRRRPRRWWVREWIQHRRTLGGTHFIKNELYNHHREDYKNMLRMTEMQFADLLNRVSALITKSDTNMRKAITPSTKLEVTLRYLATGDSFKSLEYFFRVPKNTISSFVPHTCEAIYYVLRDFIRVSTILYYVFKINFILLKKKYKTQIYLCPISINLRNCNRHRKKEKKR